MSDGTGGTTETPGTAPDGDDSDADSTGSVPTPDGTGAASEGGSTGGVLEPCVAVDLGSALGEGVTAGTLTDLADYYDFDACLGPEEDIGGEFVFAWTAPYAGQFTFSLAGSDYDTVIGIAPPTCDGIYDCNDDCDEVTSAIGFDAVEGERLLIAIGGYGGKTGQFLLSILDGAPQCLGWGTTGDPWGDDTDDWTGGSEGASFITTR